MHEHHTADQATEDYLEAAEPDYVEAPVKVSIVGDVSNEPHRPRTITTDQIPLTSSSGVLRILPELRTRDRAQLTAVGGDVVVGGPAVTLGTGYLLTAGSTLQVESTDALYAVTAAAAVTVHVFNHHRDG